MSLYSNKTYIADLDTAIESSVNLEKLAGHSVLITGATGTIGSFLVDLLQRYNTVNNAEIRIYACGRNMEKLRHMFTEANRNGLFYQIYDSHNEVTFDFYVDYIIHAAGNAYPAAFNTDPVGTIIGNIFGTYNLLEYARKFGIKRFLYISSGEVYGQGDLSLEKFDEEYAGYLNPLLPRSCYPMSKRAAENLCASYAKQFDLETVIVRPCHTFGPCMSDKDNRANAQFIRSVLNNEDLVMVSAGDQVRSYCYVADCASAILTVLINGEGGQVYNIANPDVRISVVELANLIAETAGKKVRYRCPMDLELLDFSPIKKQVLASEKIEELGWKGKFKAEDGVRHIIQILRENNVGNC